MSSIHSTNKNTSDLAEQYAAQQAEKEKIRDQHEDEMERLKKSYSSSLEHTRDRFESSIQDEKLKSYENLRNSKRKFNSIEREQERTHKQAIRNRNEEFHIQENLIEREGMQKINEATKKQAMIEEYQRNQATAAQAETRTNFSQNARQIIQQNENRIEDLRQSKLDELGRRREDHAVAIEQIREHFNDRESRVLAQHQQVSDQIEKNSEKQLNDTRLKTAARISELEEKNKDPFYRMTKLDSDFTDEGDFYQLKIKVPEHEKKGLKVQISGQNIQLTGTRNNAMNTEIEPGHLVSTNSYQTYSERFRFDVPVDAKSMERYEEDGYVYFTVPKYGPNHRMRNESPLAKVAQNDISMQKEHEFKNSLPTPTIRPDRGTRTTS